MMLRQRTLIEVLGKVNTSEVTAALLFNREGMLLAYNGYGEANASVAAALVSGIWESFERKASREDLREAILLCEDGVLAVTKVANMLIALKATHSVQIGLLRTKLRALASYLDEPLTLVSRNST